MSAGVSNAKIADKMAHTEDSVVVRDMSVCATLKITPNLFHVQLNMYPLNCNWKEFCEQNIAFLLRY